MKIFISPHTKIGYLFLTLTLTLLGGLIFVSFFAITQAEIVVKPKPFNVETTFKLEVNNQSFNEMRVFEETDEAEKEYSPETKVTVTGFAEGEVKIINNSSQAQTLIATTRLLSGGGLIFRIVEGVNVPAHGGIKVLAKADKQGKEYNLGPTKFTIPGLSVSLQKLIYAETDMPMKASSRESGLILLSDLEAAKKNLKEQLYKNIVDEIKKKLPEKNFQIITKSEVLSETTDTQVNEEKEKFKVNIKLKITAISLERDKLLKIAQDKLKENLKEEESLASFDENSLSCLIDKIDVNKKEGTVTVALRGQAKINEKSKIFDKEKIKNLTPEEVKEYFKAFDEIEEVKVNFFPPLLKKMPNSAEKIKFKGL